LDDEEWSDPTGSNAYAIGSALVAELMNSIEVMKAAAIAVAVWRAETVILKLPFFVVAPLIGSTPTSLQEACQTEKAQCFQCRW
jgi:hypothetical protein